MDGARYSLPERSMLAFRLPGRGIGLGNRPFGQLIVDMKELP